MKHLKKIDLYNKLFEYLTIENDLDKIKKTLFSEIKYINKVREFKPVEILFNIHDKKDNNPIMNLVKITEIGLNGSLIDEIGDEWKLENVYGIESLLKLKHIIDTI